MESADSPEVKKKYTPTDDALMGEFVEQIAYQTMLVSLDHVNDIIERSEYGLEIGPYVDPTRWMRQHEAEEDALEYMKLFREYRGELEKLKLKLEKKGMRKRS